MRRKSNAIADDHRRRGALLERYGRFGEYRRRGLYPIPLGFTETHRHGVKGSSSKAIEHAGSMISSKNTM
jgi:hypothetical protein